MFKKKRMKRAFILEGFSVWDLFMASYIDRKSIYEFIKGVGKKVGGGMESVLDFGCGTKPYRKFFKADRYIGVDVDVPEEGTDTGKPDIIYEGKILPFEDNSFDMILSSQVFEHIYDIKTSINEIYRVAKKGGYLCATVPFAAPEHLKPYDFFRYTEFGIKELLEEAGWKIVSIEKSTSDIDTIRQQMIFSLSSKMHSEKSVVAFFRLLFVMPIWNFLFYIKQKRKQNLKKYDFPLGIFIIARKV